MKASTTSIALGHADRRSVQCGLLYAHNKTLLSWEILTNSHAPIELGEEAELSKCCDIMVSTLLPD